MVNFSIMSKQSHITDADDHYTLDDEGHKNDWCIKYKCKKISMFETFCGES